MSYISVPPGRLSVFDPHWIRNCAIAGAMSCLALLASPVAAQTVENPPTHTASNILPKNLLSGPDFAVRQQVANDGTLYIYMIDSQYGAFQAVGTARLRQRVGEIIALRNMQTIRQSDLFVGAVRQSAAATVGTIKGTLNDPVGTVSGAVSGVSKAFSRTSESLFGSRKSETEDGQLSSLLGIAEAKRKLAYEFGVDVYSDNEPLQYRLEELARAIAIGKLSFSAATSMVPGAAGQVVTVTGVAQSANEIYRSTAPADLRAMNRRKLTTMGIPEEAGAIFMDNPKFSPREQTELVTALERLNGAARRDLFVHFAALTNDHDMALFRQRQAQMYAGYHAKVARISSFVTLGEFVAARTSDGALVFNLPVDYFVWTSWMAAAAARIDRLVAELGDVKEKRLIVSGKVSPLAQRELAARGWKLSVDQDGLIAAR